MKRLDQVVEQYLKMDTNYALMITGAWGIGKTYYYKNVLEKKVSKIETAKDASKKYKPILVSLFGINSIDEIQTEIILSLYPILKNKAVKLTAQLTKSLIKGFTHLKGVGDFYDSMSEMKVDKADWINFFELSICFDDIERMGKNLEIRDFIGYINSLVESNNVKVLLITDETKIENAKFRTIKEKTIGNSIEFVPDVEHTYKSIADIKYSTYKAYHSFLSDKKNFVLTIFTTKTTNFRTLSFIMSFFEKIFYEVELHLLQEQFLSDYKDEILLRLLKFTIAISIEYKKGEISYSDARGLNNKNFLIADMVFKNNKDAKKTYRDEFLEAYYHEKGYYYFGSIYHFITGGDVFNYDKLIEELRNTYGVQNHIIPYHNEIYNRLSYLNCFSLSDEEYLKLTRQLVQYAFEGLYDLQYYLTIFYFAARFNNPLRFDLNKLRKKILIGMNKGKNNFSYNWDLILVLDVGNNNENREHFLDIRTEALKINEELREVQEVQKNQEYEKLFYQNFDLFSEKFKNKDQEFLYSPIFGDFNSTKFYSHLINSANDMRFNISRLFAKRYEYSATTLKPELPFIMNLQKKIAKRISKKANNVSGKIFEDLNTYLLQGIKQVSSL